MRFLLCFSKNSCVKKKQKKRKKKSLNNNINRKQKKMDLIKKKYSGGIIINEKKNKRTKQILSQTGKCLIIKEIKFNPEFLNFCEDLKDLINLSAKKHNHPNLVKYLEADYSSDTFYIKTEKIEFSFEDMHLTNEKHIKSFFREILKALKYLHSKNVFNINLKPSNIFVNKFGVIKIKDYLGKSFFDILENNSDKIKSEDNISGSIENVSKDVSNLIKLLRTIVYEKEAEIENPSKYISFMKILNKFEKNNKIDFDVLFCHPFLEINPSKTCIDENSLKKKSSKENKKETRNPNFNVRSLNKNKKIKKNIGKKKIPFTKSYENTSLDSNKKIKLEIMEYKNENSMKPIEESIENDCSLYKNDSDLLKPNIKKKNKKKSSEEIELIRKMNKIKDILKEKNNETLDFSREENENSEIIIENFLPSEAMKKEIRFLKNEDKIIKGENHIRNFKKKNKVEFDKIENTFKKKTKKNDLKKERKILNKKNKKKKSNKFSDSRFTIIEVQKSSKKDKKLNFEKHKENYSTFSDKKNKFKNYLNLNDETFSKIDIKQSCDNCNRSLLSNIHIINNNINNNYVTNFKISDNVSNNNKKLNGKISVSEKKFHFGKKIKTKDNFDKYDKKKSFEKLSLNSLVISKLPLKNSEIVSEKKNF